MVTQMDTQRPTEGVEPCKVKALSTVLNGGGEETYLGDFSIWQRALPLPTKAGWYTVLADPQMPVTSTCSELITSAALLDYIADLDLNEVIIETSPC